jgi:mRNA interferase RelE/StbE
MVWRIEFAPAAAKELDRLDGQVARRILVFLRDRVAPLDDPRSLGEALKGSELGKYRIGPWRIVCHIEDTRLLVTVVRIGHRREVYR